jgi:hypothetical protein
MMRIQDYLIGPADAAANIEGSRRCVNCGVMRLINDKLLGLHAG